MRISPVAQIILFKNMNFIILLPAAGKRIGRRLGSVCCKSFGSPQTAQIPIKYLILTLFLAFPLVKQLFTICYLWLPDFFAPGVGSKDIGELRSSKSVS